MSTPRPRDRLFLDANVLFSASYTAGSRLVALWGHPRCILCTSSHTLAEAERNARSGAQRARLARLIEGVEVVDDSGVPIPTMPGLAEKDLPVLRGALAASATHLVTGDKRHFGEHYGKRLLGVLVVRPAGYLEATPR